MSEDRYYLRFKGRVLGPFTSEKAIEMVKRGQITRQHELSPDGATWRLAETYEELFATSRTRSNSMVSESKKASSQENKGNAALWFANFDGMNQGPVEEDGILAWIATGKVGKDTMVWKEGMANWLEAQAIKPEWFLGVGERAISKKTDNEALDTKVWSDQAIAEITFTIMKSRGWMLFLGIFGIVLGVLGAIGSAVLFISEISSSGSGPAKAVPVVATLIQLVSCVVWLFVSILLIRVTSRLQVLQIQPSVTSLHATFLAYNRFWTTLGLFVLVWSTVALLFVLIVLVSGVRIASVDFPSNIQA
jgi:hypothetical protein